MRRLSVFLFVVAVGAIGVQLSAQPAAPPPAPAGDARQWAGQLAADLSALNDTLRAQVKGPARLALTRQTDEALERTRKFFRALKEGANREALYREHAQLDRALHGLAEAVRRQAPEDRSLRRLLARLDYTGEQLHFALGQGDAGKDRRRESAARLAHALDAQADALLRTAGEELPGGRVGERFERAGREFAQSAARLHKALDGGATPEKTTREFEALRAAWKPLAARTAELPLGERPALRAQAARTERLYGNLARLFGVADVAPAFHVNVTKKQAAIVVGAGAGGGPHVRVFQDRRGGEALDLFAYDLDFRGGVRVALGDVKGDGVTDIVTAPGPGMAPTVRVFSGRDLSLLGEFNAYDARFTGGVFVATADVNREGRANIVTGADKGGSSHVRVFDGVRGRLRREFQAYEKEFTGGVRVAVGDVDGDGYPDIVTGPGPGRPPTVRVFSGKDFSLLGEFDAFDPRYTGGIFVAVADVTGKDRTHIVAGPDGGSVPNVRVFEGLKGRTRVEFPVYAREFTGGVRVAVRDVDGDGVLDVLTAPGAGTAPTVRILSGKDRSVLNEFNAFDPLFLGGAFIATR